MYKTASYKEKFVDLQEWFPHVIESVKRDLKNEHLKKDYSFVKKFLSSKNLNKLTTEELVHAYQKAIQEEEKGEELAEFITSRWLLKNSELYHFFEQQLSQIQPDFSALEELTSSQAQRLIDASIQQFGAPHTYLFAVLNSVVFPKESFEALRKQAQQHQQKQQEEDQQTFERQTVENMQKTFELEKARLIDKYEKKLAGMQKKYTTDVEALKKQVVHLQRKLQEKSPS